MSSVKVLGMAIKERRTKLLLGLFLLSDVDFKPVQLNQTLEIAFDLTLNQKTKATVASLLREGSIEKIDAIDENVQTQYALTAKGFKELCLDFPFFRFLRENWDGRWRILSYEIPEKKRELRDKLRREVAGWGLGPWHRSFWVTPHPIIDNLRMLVSQKEEEQYIQAFEAEHVFGNKEILIEKVWQKSDLDRRYRELFKQWHEVLSSNPEGATQSDVKLEKLRIVVDKYVNILRDDPGLPPELIGQNWIGYEAFNIYKEIRAILLS
ncbi:MAG: PaaX family transcriptional regulator C-terminal domain-containing protein [Patescibacteria group bacterium]